MSDSPQTSFNELRLCLSPIFIIGSPRSGTSILAGSMAQHTHLWTADESQFLWDLFYDGRADANFQRVGRADGGSWLHNQGVGRAEFRAFLGLGLNALFTRQSQGRRWIDHTPVYTDLADLLAEMFPGAIFLHMLRDGRKVVHSMMNYLSIFRGDPKVLPWGTDFTEACIQWRHFVEVSMEFAARHPARCLTVTNEALVADPDNSFRKIFAFMGVPFEEAPASFFRENRWNSSFLTIADQRPSGSDPWNEWTLEQRRAFAAVAGQTLIKCGFATEEDLQLLDDQQGIGEAV